MSQPSNLPTGDPALTIFVRHLVRGCALVLFAVVALPAAAHEFWLDPVSFTPKPGAVVPILWRNGLNFLGDSYPYQRSWAKRFTVHDARGERPVKGVEGDDPAVEVRLPVAGVAIVAFERSPDILEYKSVDQFLITLDYEGLDELARRYRAMTDPPAIVRESYVRYAKTLLSIGAGPGEDHAIGLPFEIVVETNPYTLASGRPLTARVVRDGKPAPDVLIKAFSLNDPQSPRRMRTDAAGRAVIEGVPAGEVLLNAVVMSPGDPKASNEKLRADWNSLWASVTFKRK